MIKALWELIKTTAEILWIIIKDVTPDVAQALIELKNGIDPFLQIIGVLGIITIIATIFRKAITAIFYKK